jgi:hypothetical protein
VVWFFSFRLLFVPARWLRAMRPPNEFWLCLHRLAQAYDAEGLSRAERGENIVLQFSAMPPTARRQVLGELAELTIALSELYPQTMVVVKDQEKPAADEQPPQRDAG